MGRVYHRDPETEAVLIELLPLSEEEILGRCSIRERSNPGYVPSECLVYLFRANRTKKPGPFLEALFKLLQERVLCRFPRPGSANDTLTSSAIREKVYGSLIELLARDRNEYEEKLDYYEVRFDGAVSKLRLDAQKKVWREDNRRAPLEIEESSGEFTREVQEALGTFDPFSASELERSDYRFRLDQAIDSLTLEQRRIVEMIRQDIPIDSKDPQAITIARTLGKSERTIRLHRDQAYARLRTLLRDGGAE